jgi:hypothetical protein
MKKVISLFKRDYKGNHQVFDEIVPGAEWVVSGEGIATIKIDGTSCLVRDGFLFKRYDAKKGRTPPAGFEPAQDPDPITGHWPGWVPVTDRKEDNYHREAFENCKNLPNGTYELIGEKIQRNPYNISGHVLVLHGEWRFKNDPPRTFDELKAWFETNEKFEGIVWHRADGEMVKIKRRDFGLAWPPAVVVASRNIRRKG